MIKNLDDIKPNAKLEFSLKDTKRLKSYEINKQIYNNNFEKAFPKLFRKLRKRFPAEETTAQTLIKINLFYVMTEFFKFLATNGGVDITVSETNKNKFKELTDENNLMTTIKEVFVDNSRYGNGLFKVSMDENEKPVVYSISPAYWQPFFVNGNINEIEGHALFYFVDEDKILIEKHYKGYLENELYNYNKMTNSLGSQLDVADIDLLEREDFTGWDDFLIFPVKNTTDSEDFYGMSDYELVKSIIEDIMLAMSQNSKVINRHANPKLTGSEQNLEFDAETGQRKFPDSDFVPVGNDKVKPEYLSVNLQSDSVKTHIDMLLDFFFMLSKTPPQAYGKSLTTQMSGKSLQLLFMLAITKVNDIRQISFDNSLKQVCKCLLALSGVQEKELSIKWNTALPEDVLENSQRIIGEFRAGLKSVDKGVEALNPEMTPDQLKEEVSKIDAYQKANVAKSFSDLGLINTP